MPTIGIMRYLCDNDYTFIAREQEGKHEGNKILKDVSVYHDNTSSMIGDAGPWKQMYEKAFLINNGAVLLAMDEKNRIFSGDEQFPLYTITDGQYADIFEHSKDLEKLMTALQEWYDAGYVSVFGAWFPETDEIKAADYEEKRRKTYEAQKAHLLAGNLPKPEKLELGRIISAAMEQGFTERVVNGRPRAVAH